MTCSARSVAVPRSSRHQGPRVTGSSSFSFSLLFKGGLEREIGWRDDTASSLSFSHRKVSRELAVCHPFLCGRSCVNFKHCELYSLPRGSRVQDQWRRHHGVIAMSQKPFQGPARTIARLLKQLHRGVAPLVAVRQVLPQAPILLLKLLELGAHVRRPVRLRLGLLRALLASYLSLGSYTSWSS